MNSNKFLISWLAGSAVLFFAGYLIYGMLLSSYMTNHAGTATGVARSANDFLLWLIAIANVLYALLITYVFSKAGVSSVGRGVAFGATLGFLTSASTDCVSYATANLLTPAGIAADVMAFTVLTALAGGVIAAIRGMKKKAIA